MWLTCTISCLLCRICALLCQFDGEMVGCSASEAVHAVNPPCGEENALKCLERVRQCMRPMLPRYAALAPYSSIPQRTCGLHCQAVPHLYHILPYGAALVSYSATGDSIWRNINQVRLFWQDIAQVWPHLCDIPPFLPHLRDIVPVWWESGKILRKCAGRWQDMPQVCHGLAGYAASAPWAGRICRKCAVGWQDVLQASCLRGNRGGICRK